MQWTDIATKAFEEIKTALANTTLLVHPMSDAPINIMTDVSDMAIGGVLQQYIDGNWCPLSYFSRKLSPAEQHYSTFDRELLAVYCAIWHFRHFVEGREFFVLTDHKLLTHSLNSKPDRHSPRQVRHLDFISQFTTNIRHIARKRNPVADALSRLGEGTAQLNAVTPAIDFSAMAKAQPSATNLQTLRLPPSLQELKFQCVLTPYCVISLQEHLDPMYQSSSDAQCLIHYIICLTQVLEPHNG